MTKNLKGKSRWTENNFQKFRAYIKKEGEYLKEYFYNCLKDPNDVQRKKIGFFKEMSAFVGKSSQKCKSRFQKCEEEIYCEFLKLPLEHFELYMFFRSNRINKQFIVTRKKKRIKKIIKDSKYLEMDSKRKLIISSVNENINEALTNVSVTSSQEQVAESTESINQNLFLEENLEDLQLNNVESTFSTDLDFDDLEKKSFCFSVCETHLEDLEEIDVFNFLNEKKNKIQTKNDNLNSILI